MAEGDVREQITRFIRKTFPSARRHALSTDDPLLESGIIDSLGVLTLVEFLEAEFQMTVTDDDLVPEHFGTIERIAEFVENRRARIGA